MTGYDYSISILIKRRVTHDCSAETSTSPLDLTVLTLLSVTTVFFFFFGSDKQAVERMKAVMIFLVLTLVVVMAEVGHGDIINTGNTETTGGLYVEGRKVTQLPPGYGPIINSGNTGTTGCITTEPFECRCTCGTSQGEVAGYKLMRDYQE
ncbi:uncharacterized protein AB9X84_002298 isoform 2-T2 [Acanthopagrus schlegelii]